MTVWEIITLFALLFVAYTLGRISVLWPLYRLADRVIKESPELAEAMINEHEPLELEQHSGQWFAYGDGGRFLAQHGDLTALFESLLKSNPGKTFRLGRNGFSDEEFTAITAHLTEAVEKARQ